MGQRSTLSLILLNLLFAATASSGASAQTGGPRPIFTPPPFFPTGTGIAYRVPFAGSERCFSTGYFSRAVLVEPSNVERCAPHGFSSPNDLQFVQATDQLRSFKRSIAFRDFLQTTKPEEVLCASFQELFGLKTDNSKCLELQHNSGRTLFVQVIIGDETRKIYEIEIRGKSELLALRIPNWTERHRFYIAFGFSGDMMPYLTVFDAEPLMKNTPNVEDTDDRFYQNVDRAKYDLIRVFQERVKSVVARQIRERFERYYSESVR